PPRVRGPIPRPSPPRLRRARTNPPRRGGRPTRPGPPQESLRPSPRPRPGQPVRWPEPPPTTPRPRATPAPGTPRVAQQRPPPGPPPATVGAAPTTSGSTEVPRGRCLLWPERTARTRRRPPAPEPRTAHPPLSRSVRPAPRVYGRSPMRADPVTP